jgi:hypothetical protein
MVVTVLVLSIKEEIVSAAAAGLNATSASPVRVSLSIVVAFVADPPTVRLLLPAAPTCVTTTSPRCGAPGTPESTSSSAEAARLLKV